MQMYECLVYNVFFYFPEGTDELVKVLTIPLPPILLSFYLSALFVSGAPPTTIFKTKSLLVFLFVIFERALEEILFGYGFLADLPALGNISCSSYD